MDSTKLSRVHDFTSCHEEWSYPYNGKINVVVAHEMHRREYRDLLLRR